MKSNQIGIFGRFFGKLILPGWLIWFAGGIGFSAENNFPPITVVLSNNISGAEIQTVLDHLPSSGGEVVLPAGNFLITEPLVLRRNHQTLRGAGDATVLRLAANANCPVIILGEPVNQPQKMIEHLKVCDLFIDGNRRQQQREAWQLSGEGSQIHNNGITAQAVGDSLVERVTCANCRSGGLVTARGVRRLTVRKLTAFNNEFDGLACYETEQCRFTELNLHDNPGAGISLDLAFNHNVISNAVLESNDLGIFMRASRANQFFNVTIRDSHHFGVFMAQTANRTAEGWIRVPQTECTDNVFTDLRVVHCGSAAFRVNDASCTNNVLIRPRFGQNSNGGLSLVQPDLITVQ